MTWALRVAPPMLNFSSVVLIVLIGTVSCSYPVAEIHEYAVAENARSGMKECVVLRIREEGKQHLFVVDGRARKTNFVRGDYFLLRDSMEIDLEFLSVKRSIELWDNIEGFRIAGLP